MATPWPLRAGSVALGVRTQEVWIDDRMRDLAAHTNPYPSLFVAIAMFLAIASRRVEPSLSRHFT